MSLPKYESEALSIRVQRLLRGDSNPHDDLTAVFLALRDYSGGRACVVEIGNFIAHRGERNVGIITREAREFFAIVRFLYQQPKPALSLSNLPKNFSELLGGTFRRVDNPTLRSKLHVKRQVAERYLNEMLSRIQEDTNGSLFLSWPTDQDIALINCLLGQIVMRPAFSNQQLTTELFAVLVANGLLRKEEQRAFRQLETVIGLFAVSQMHRCVVDLGDGTKAELRAGATHSQREIFVNAAAELFGVNPTGKVFISANFFATNIDVIANAVSDLHPPSDQQPEWSFPIQLGSDGKLRRLS
jgi:hypothetical protein